MGRLHTRYPRRPCPACGEQVAVSTVQEIVRPHKRRGERCPGSGQRIDIWSD